MRPTWAEAQGGSLSRGRNSEDLSLPLSAKRRVSPWGQSPLATKDGNEFGVEGHRAAVPSTPQKSRSSICAPPLQSPCVRPDAGDAAGTPSDKIPAIPGLAGWPSRHSESVYCAG